ncbi:FAD binding domain-containing protein [Alphaproteobacteria bacterium]|nr:FAD binding domain-containing protein [Alphaproteobacteria bacterium]
MADLKNTIFVNSKKVEVNNVHHDITLLDWLRNHHRMTGTKEGCAEGDCGACSVIIDENGSGSSRPINSCLIRLGQVMGRSVTTIEGVGCVKNPHPLQIAFTNEHASQCGYCTPGFIMSGISLLNSNKKITDETINDAISGNLCRCTGYSPIIKAIKSVAKNRITQNNSQSINKIKKITLGNVTYLKPSNLKELKKHLDEIKSFQFLAGGTDLNLQRPIINQKEDKIICLDSITELNTIKHFKQKIVLGGGVTIESFLEAVRLKMPELVEILQRFGSPQIRNQGTVGGNLCTSSPIGDIAPILLVLNSDLNVFGRNGSKKINIKNFFKGYRKNVLQKDEIISSVEIPFANKKNKIFSWKLSKRYDQDISTVSLAINIQTHKNIIKELHLAAGGVAAIPKMLDNLSNQMLEKKIDDAIQFAIDNLEQYIQPISDLRGSSHYRLEAIKGLFRRLQTCLIQNKNSLSIMDF